MFHKKSFSPIVVSALTFVLFLSVFGQQKSPNTVFSNTTPITINSATGTTAVPIPATLYPSNINVSGMSGNTTRVAVTLTGLTKGRVSDLDFLLVSPNGAKFIFFSDGANNSFSTVSTDAVYTFSDDAATFFPNFGTLIFPGNYLPASGDSAADTFPAPAPAAPYNQPNAATFASTFNGASPNGTWSLYAVDDTVSDAGTLNSGWSLTITTTGSPQTFTNSASIGFNDTLTNSNPYGTPINISGMTGVISNIKVTLTGLSHQAPQDIDILLVNPIGTGFILMSDVGGSPVANTNLTFDDAAANVIFNGFGSGTYKPSNQSADPNDFFLSPAPLRPYYGEFFSGTLSSFNGLNPNGEWRLFVIDDSSNNAGSISGGWSIDITTTPLVLPSLGCALPSFATTAYPANISPTNLAVGDFNNDNKQDVVVTNQISNDISILLGTGTGSFLPQTLVASGGSGPYGIAAGNFNADSNLDFVVTNSGANTVSLFLGNGNGTFSTPNNFTVGASPLSVAVGDFNNDGKKDIAVVNFGGFFSGAVSILLGNGTGGFGIPRTLRTATQPSSVLIGRFNGDANDDIAVTNFGADSISVFNGSGTGTFTLFQTLQTNPGSGPVAMEYYDYSGDGPKDLIIANYNSNRLRSYFGTGNGFQIGSGENVDIGENPIALVRANVLGGTFDSLAVALNGVDQISVSNFSSIINTYSRFTVGLNPNDIDKGDFNGDGKIDLITANAGSNDVSVLLNTCGFANGNIFDFDGDRVTDFSVYRASQSRWLSGGLFGLSQDKVFARPTDIIAPADYDGDGRTDYGIFRPENGLWYVTKYPDSPIHFQQFGLAGDIPAPADFDGDRKADIAVFRPSIGTWYIRRSSDNSFQTIPFGSNGDKPVAADYDGDGKADIAVYRPSNGVWYIFRSSDSQFDIRQFGISTDKIVPADYDADGKTDLAVFRDGTWYLMKTTTGFSVENFGSIGDIPVPGDYDSDGKIDIAVFRPSSSVWYLQRSSAGFTAFAFGLSTDFPLPSAYVR
jgi:subtilisin-like proprotein convertase family protein